MTIESKGVRFAIPAVLVFIFAAVAFYHLGNRPLIDYDESIYAQVAREALQNHSQLDLTWLGYIAQHKPPQFFDKPPLIIWLVETSQLVFGINEFSARFWTAIFAILTLPLVFLFTQKLSQSSAAATLAVAAFFAAFQFDDFAGVLQLDIPVGFFVLLALYSFWQAGENGRYHLLFWVAMGLGVMTKSVIGLLPLPVVLIYSAAQADFKWLKSKNFLLGGLLFLAIVLPWHILQQIRYGGAFWDQYLTYHLLKRYAVTLDSNGGSPHYYLDIFFRQRILFCCLLPSLVWFIARSFKSKPHFFLTVTLLFIFLFFSAAATKLPPYILVAYPYVAIMIGMMLAALAGRLEKSGKNSGNIFIAAVILVFVAASLEHKQIRLAQENDPQLVSDKAVGEYLKTHNLGQHVYYYSVNWQKPAVIYYSNRPVYINDFYRHPRPEDRFILISEKPPQFPGKTLLFPAGTEQVYQIE
jgi:4-amino-4-deoxy-L-arabinose transferase-like glycosyltransferase